MSNGMTTFAEATDTQAVAVVPTAEQTRAGEPPPVRSLSLYEYEATLASFDDADDTGLSVEQKRHLAEITLMATEQKRDAVARFIRTLGASVDSLKEEEEYLRTRRKAIERRLDSLKLYVAVLVDQYAPPAAEEGGVRRLEGRVFKLCTQRNPVSVEITDEPSIPLEYQTATIIVPAEQANDIVQQFDVKGIVFETSKTAIKKAIEAGIEVPGAELRQTRSLRVR